MSVLEYADDWSGPLKGGSDGYARLEWSNRYRRGAWSWDFGKLRLYRVSANRDAARFYHRLQNDLPFEPGERFDVAVDLRMLEMTSLGIGRSWQPQPGLWIESRLRLLRAETYLDGALHGTALADSQGGLHYQAQLDYRYDQDALFDRPVSGPYGYGAATELRLSWDWSPVWRLHLEAQDLGAVSISDAPATTGEVDSQTRREGADGSLQFDPTLRGREYFEDATVSLPWSASLALERRWSRWNASAGLRRTPVRYQPQLRLGWAPRPDCDLAIALEAAAKLRAGLHLRWGWVDAAFVSDAVDVADAHSLRAQLGLRIPVW